ncbi:MAG: metallophosphoesterase [Anaerolineae bacterium]|nr:metallophosphoesterase [Anaerolineae bacterium]
MTEPSTPRPRLTVRLPVLLAALAGGLMLYAVGGERPRLHLQRYRLSLPHGAGLRILHLADQHFGGDGRLRRRRLENLRRLLPGLRVDLIAFTGDFLHNDAGLDAVETMMRLLPSAPLGRYAVLGNHDYAEYSWRYFFIGLVAREIAAAPTPAARLTAAWNGMRRVLVLGWQILRNHPLQFARLPNDTRELRALLELYDVQILDNTAVPVPGHPGLWVAGVDDPLEGTPDLARALAVVPPGNTIILLTHHPDLAFHLPDDRFVLALAGHTHGGQVILPGLGAIHTQGTRLPRRQAAGYFELSDRTRLIVSRGMGESTPFRFRCPPEVGLVELESGDW